MYTVPTIDLIKTGINLKKLRRKAGLSVGDLQSILMVAPQTIYKWQAGIMLPTVDNLVILSSVLGVKIDDIIVRRTASEG